MAYQEYDPDTGDFGTTINAKGEVNVLRETARAVESGSRSATGSANDAELLTDAERALKEWWDKCWQTSPCMCAALRPTDFFKMGYLVGHRAHERKSPNVPSSATTPGKP